MDELTLQQLVEEWEASPRYKGKSGSSFYRFLRKEKGISIGAPTAYRWLEQAKGGGKLNLVPRKVRKWEALGKDGKVVELHHVAYDVQADPAEAIEAIVKAKVPKLPKAKPHKGNDLLMVLSLPDQHVGKLAWEEEVGENYDIHIAVSTYIEAVSHLLAATQHYKPGRVLYVVGNDLVHTDNSSNTTTAGTPQDVDSRWAKVVGAAFRMIAGTIDALAEVANVDVVAAPGNHDRHTTYMIGFALEQRYREDGRVTIINRPTYREYYRQGKLLFGITHGNDVKEDKLPLIMATERPKDWGETRWREWFLGHHHRKRQTQTVGVHDELGVMVTRLPSLTAVDSWHHDRGYSAMRHAEARVYDAKGGVLVGTAVHVV